MCFRCCWSFKFLQFSDICLCGLYIFYYISGHFRQFPILDFGLVHFASIIASQMEMGIYPVGFPDMPTVLPALRSIYEARMLADRETLRDLIVRADRPYLTRDLFTEITDKCIIM